MSKPSIFEMLENFSKDRPVMEKNNQDLGRLMQLMLGEVAELQEAIAEGESVDFVAEEISDIIIFSISIMNLLERDTEAQIRDKIAINTLRYPAVLFDGKHSYEEARRQGKEGFTHEDKEEFYS